MDTREWALLVFTILGQLAAGALIVLLVVRAYVVRKAGVEQADRLTDQPLYMIVPIVVLALLASLLHLGSPLHIARAVPNLGTSWLSREVVTTVSFVVIIGVYAFLQWRKVGTDSVRSVIGWIAAGIGLFQIYAMGMVYMIRTQPSWNTLVTPVSFITTALLLGVVAVAATLVANYAKLQVKKADKLNDLVPTILKSLAFAAICLLGVEFLILPIYLAYLATQGTAALTSLNAMFSIYGFTLALRLLLVFLGAGVLAAYLYRNAATLGQEKSLATVAYSAFVLVLIAEMMGRFLFYATRMRIGL